MLTDTNAAEKRISELLGELWVIFSQYSEFSAQISFRNEFETHDPIGAPSSSRPNESTDIKHELHEAEMDFQVNFERRLRELYSSVVFVLDARALHKYLGQFEAEFKDRCNDPNELYNSGSCFGDAEEFEHPLLADISRFLRPILGKDSFDLTYPLIYLENILRGTANIILEKKVEIKGEADIYNAVKSIVTVAFPTTKKAGANFLKIAKTYKPDILVPEAKTAIEYKYIKEESDLKKMLEQLVIDAKGYEGDDQYLHFYAVLYFDKPFFSEDQVDAMWKEYKFPKNWKYIYQVAGNLSSEKPTID